MKNKKQILVKFLIRVALGFAIIFCANRYLEWKEIPISVGFNAISFLTSGLLGVPGVAMLYGVVACPFL